MDSSDPYGLLVDPYAQPINSGYNANPSVPVDSRFASQGYSSAPNSVLLDPRNSVATAASPLLNGNWTPSRSPGMTDSEARQSVLDKIASGESPDYNTIYGGSKFDSYSDHPRSRVPIPGTNESSDAAGRYQFLSSTWDAQKAKLGLKDFSPENQDSAAWDLANTTYKNKTGSDLLSDAKNGSVNWNALSGQWPSLSKNNVASSVPSQYGSTKSPLIGAEGGPAHPGGLYAMAMLQSMFPQHKFTPIEYDPWKYEPKLQGGTLS